MPTKALYGRYLEDFRVGEVIEHWPGRTVTEADDMLFCMLTMNHHPLHSDAKYAADTQFGQRIVAGPLVYSLVFGMTVATSEMRHLAPVFHGDTLYARTEVLAVRDSKSQPDRGIVSVKTEGLNQKDEVVLEFQRAVMLPKRSAAAD